MGSNIITYCLKDISIMNCCSSIKNCFTSKKLPEKAPLIDDSKDNYDSVPARDESRNVGKAFMGFFSSGEDQDQSINKSQGCLSTVWNHWVPGRTACQKVVSSLVIVGAITTLSVLYAQKVSGTNSDDTALSQCEEQLNATMLNATHAYELMEYASSSMQGYVEGIAAFVNGSTTNFPNMLAKNVTDAIPGAQDMANSMLNLALQLMGCQQENVTNT
jgi:hypothetical protein